MKRIYIWAGILAVVTSAYVSYSVTTFAQIQFAGKCYAGGGSPVGFLCYPNLVTITFGDELKTACTKDALNCY